MTFCGRVEPAVFRTCILNCGAWFGFQSLSVSLASSSCTGNWTRLLQSTYRSSKDQELLVNPYIVFYFFWTLIPKVDVLVDISKHRSWTFCPQLQPWIFCHSPTPRIDYKIWSWKTPGVSNALPQNRSRTPIRMVMCTHTHEQCSNLPAKKGRMLKFSDLLAYCLKHSKNKVT